MPRANLCGSRGSRKCSLRTLQGHSTQPARAVEARLQPVSVSRLCGTWAKSLSWCVTFSKQALGFLLPSLDRVMFLLTFTWA